MAPPNETGPRIAPQNDLYTVMLIVATALLLFGIVYLAMRSIQLFGTLLPSSGA
ncbi:MAG: hypothetical protein GXY44_00020 [Phycisphaerales bacterium]|nr:hypothetical protein [Phycisphaerales bacterium]